MTLADELAALSRSLDNDDPFDANGLDTMRRAVEALRRQEEREADVRDAIGAAITCLRPLRGKPKDDGDNTQRLLNLGTSCLFDARDLMDGKIPCGPTDDERINAALATATRITAILRDTGRLRYCSSLAGVERDDVMVRDHIASQILGDEWPELAKRIADDTRPSAATEEP